jgi:CheY-like chemotaxis protein
VRAPEGAAALDRPLRILIAEDDRELRRLLSFILRCDGHQVVEAGDGSEVLEVIASELLEGQGRRFDVIISEQGIPGIPGVSLLAGIRAFDHAMPFILITGDPEVEAEAGRLGAVVLPRPLTVAKLRRAIRES